MSYGIAAVIGIVVGLAIGFGAERVATTPLIQSIAAALVGMLLGSVVAAGMWLLRPPPDAEILAVSFGLVEGLVASALVLCLAVAVHACLGWIGVIAHRGLIMGVLGALSGAVATVSGAGLIHGVK